MANARLTAAKALLRTETTKAYSNLAWNRLLSETDLSPQDKRFATALYYGTLEQQLLLDHLIGLHYSGGQRLKPTVRVILRMGLYQLIAMSGVRDAAAVDESVRLTRLMGQPRAAGLVNALLRSFLRSKKELCLPDPQEDPAGHLALKYSYPKWLFLQHRQDYGFDRAAAIAKSSLGTPPVWIRVNTLRTTAERLTALLAEEGVAAEPCPFLPDTALRLSDTDAIERSSAYRQGLFHVQDIASQLCAAALSPRAGETVIDVCAAPGGKSFTMAEMMENTGRVIALDRYESRTRLITSGARRMGLSAIETGRADGTVGNPDWFGKADAVLCDVPCGGLGVVRRKPEIKLKPQASFADLPELQYRILCRSADYLRAGGRLLYSTCSLSKAENDAVAARFLAEHADFTPRTLFGIPERLMDKPDHQLTLFPDNGWTDGFYFASFLKKSEVV